MTANIKTLLIGTTIASIISMGQADAFTLSNPFAKKPAPTAQDSGQGGSVPADHENFKSTYIYPLTKKTVAIINSAKSLKEAQDKLCGKSLMSSGLMRQNGGAICKKTPHSAMMAIALCEGSKIDGTDCGQGAKKALWGEANATKPLSQLMGQKITQQISIKPIGPDKFTNEFNGINENAGWIFSEAMQILANPQRISAEELQGYGMTNLRYLLCNSKRENLPQTLRILANETCYNAPMQGASKMQPNRPGMLQQDPSLSPYDTGADTALDQMQENIVPSKRASGASQLPITGALRDMRDRRASLPSPDWEQPEYGQDDLGLNQEPTSRRAPQTSAKGNLITEAQNLSQGFRGMTGALKAGPSASINEAQGALARKAPVNSPAWMVREPKAQDQANMPDDVREICNNLARANATDIKNTLEPIYFDSIDSNPNIDDTTKNNIAAGLYSGDILQVRRAGQNICRNLN